MTENTYRTILFEEFDSSKEENLFTILPAEDSNLDEEDEETVYQDVKEKLSVHSFDEFLERFAPKVYEKYEPAPDGGVPIVTYSTEQSDGAIPLDIVSNSYYKMLLKLYRSKEKSGESNLKFNYDEIFDQLKPQKEVENAKMLRKQLAFAYKKYYECRDKGESTDKPRKMFNGFIKKIREQYGKSVINLLPIAMADLDTKIQSAEKCLALSAGKKDDDFVQVASGYTAFFKPDGSIDTAPVQIQASTDTTEELPKQLGGGKRKLLSAVIESDYDKETETQNDFVKSLVVSTYAPLPTSNLFAEMTVKEIQQLQEANRAKKEVYKKIFQNAKATFIQAMTEIVQKLLGVQVMFDHATSEGKLQDGVIIANCSVGQLMQEEKAFKKFIKKVGEELDNRVWFGIVPNVSDTSADDGSDALADDGSDALADDDSDDGNENPLEDDSGKTVDAKQKSVKTVSMNELKQFLPIMDEAGIMTVFSFQAGEDNGFRMRPEYVEEKRDLLSEVNNRHAVYAYPNFTLTPEKNIELFDGAEELKIPSVYIDAAYTAGGLLIGSQQPSYLKKHGLNNVHRQLPCVRINFENTEVRKQLVTKFNREPDYDVHNELRDKIDEDRFGFVFLGDKMGDMQNTYVYIANTLYKAPGSDVYRPIYATLVEDYVRAVYTPLPDKTPKGIQKDFLKKTVAGWKKCAESKGHQNDVNLLLHENEDIVLEDNAETGKPELKIKLSAVEMTLNDLSITLEQNQ